MKSKRHYVPCRRCGCEHTNPASSSLCNACGSIEYLENIERNREMREFEKDAEAMYIKDSIEEAAAEYAEEFIYDDRLTSADILEAFMKGAKFGENL